MSRICDMCNGSGKIEHRTEYTTFIMAGLVMIPVTNTSRYFTDCRTCKGTGKLEK